MPSVTATTTQEITLAPETKIKLLSAITAYEALRRSINELVMRRDGVAKVIEDIQIELGQSSIEVEGYKSTIVAGMSKTFNKKKFVALGGDLGLYEAARISKPKKTYVRITAPGEVVSNDESEGDE